MMPGRTSSECSSSKSEEPRFCLNTRGSGKMLKLPAVEVKMSSSGAACVQGDDRARLTSR
jgi:hypothetical protein